MPSHRETRQQGKQYDHEHLLHDTKGKMIHGGLERHEDGDCGYKHPHDHGTQETKMK